MKYEDLTAEQKEKTDGKTPEEILAIAKAEGYSLSDEELEAISGGVSAWDEYVSALSAIEASSVKRAKTGKNAPVVAKCI